MDIYCPTCGEPWDNDCIHEEVEAREYAGISATYAKVSAEFRRDGCKALGEAFGTGACKPTGAGAARVSSALFDLLGDDMDGAAAMMADMGGDFSAFE